MSAATASSDAPLWFSLPPGFTPLGDRVPSEITDVLTDGLSEPAAQALRAAVEASDAMLAGLARSPLQFHAAGMHPREDGGQDLSQLSIGRVPVEPGAAEDLLLGVAQGEEAREDTTAVYVRDFTAGTAVVAERATVADPGTMAGLGAAVAEPVELRGIRVSFAHPSNRYLVVIDLVTKAVGEWTAYKEVVLGLLAESVSFISPEDRAAAEARRQQTHDRLSARLDGPTEGKV